MEEITLQDYCELSLFMIADGGYTSKQIRDVNYLNMLLRACNRALFLLSLLEDYKYVLSLAR